MDDLVGRQVRRWEEWQSRASEHVRHVIAISRFRYSGAHVVAERVADRLGYGFFGSEIVDEIAKSEGIQRDLVAGLDERAANAIERYVIEGFRHRQFAEDDYVQCVTKLVSTLARRGQAVILGRGSVAIVDPAQALRVLVVAPFEWRRGRLAEMGKLSEEEASKRLRVEDEQRLEFHRRCFHFRQDDPLNYDLVVNTAALGIDAAAATVVEAFHRRFHEARG